MQIIGGARWLDEPLGQNIGGLEPLGPHEVGAYASLCMMRLSHHSVTHDMYVWLDNLHHTAMCCCFHRTHFTMSTYSNTIRLLSFDRYRYVNFLS